MKRENSKELILVPFSNIEPDELEVYIYSKIDFDCSEDIWTDINNGYAEFYNSLPSHSCFNEEEAFEYMVNYLKEEKVIFPVDKLRIIHKYIFEFLVCEKKIFSDE